MCMNGPAHWFCVEELYEEWDEQLQPKRKVSQVADLEDQPVRRERSSFDRVPSPHEDVLTVPCGLGSDDTFENMLLDKFLFEQAKHGLTSHVCALYLIFTVIYLW